MSSSRPSSDGRSSSVTLGVRRPRASIVPSAASGVRPNAFRASPSVVARPSTSTRVPSTSVKICRARRTPASVRTYTRILRVCPRRRVSRESISPSSARERSVRGTWLRRSRAPSAMPAWFA
ncbi:MAG TPA: hypothetical protein VF992_10080, partial [Thermoplasmata archaeon]